MLACIFLNFFYNFEHFIKRAGIISAISKIRLSLSENLNVVVSDYVDTNFLRRRGWEEDEPSWTVLGSPPGDCRGLS